MPSSWALATHKRQFPSLCYVESFGMSLPDAAGRFLQAEEGIMRCGMMHTFAKMVTTLPPICLFAP